MATVTLGSKGLLNADLIIVQNASFAATFTHLDENGDPIDHTGWIGKARFLTPEPTILDGYVLFGTDGDIVLNLPANLDVPIGKYDWDLMVRDTSGNVTRIAYGRAQVVDSFAFDGE